MRHELASLRRSLSSAGLSRGEIERLIDELERLYAERDEIRQVLGDLGPAWSDARAAP